MTGAANPHELLHGATVRAVEGWRRHPAVRVAVTSDFWREGARVALEDLNSGVGTLDQFDISWLVVNTLGARTWYPDGTSWPVPEWSTDPRGRDAGIKLLRVVTALGQLLASEGVPLDPEGLADRLVLAQFLTLEGLVDSPDDVTDLVNLGSVGSVREDGRSIGTDWHAGDRERRALNRLQKRLVEKIRTPREGVYDDALRAVLAKRPAAKANAISRGCVRKEDWAEPLWSKFSDLDVTTIRRALQRIRGVTTKQ